MYNLHRLWLKISAFSARRSWLALRLVLILAGLALILSPLIMQAYARYSQQRLLQEFRTSTSEKVYPAKEISRAKHPAVKESETSTLLSESRREVTAAEDPTGSRRETERVNHSGEKWPPTVIMIPKIGVKAVVVEGVTPEDLRRGPGHYPETAWPGEPGNVGIAGHRTTYGAWFRHLDKLVPGDAIYLKCEERLYHYRVEKVWVTNPYDWSVVEPTPYPALTLTACEPPYRAIRRLVVRAVLVRETENASGREQLE